MRTRMRAAAASVATLALLLPLPAAAFDDEPAVVQADYVQADFLDALANDDASASLTGSGAEFDAPLGRVVSDAELASQRGGDVHLESNATGTVHDNVAQNVTTGNNTIADSAFGNAAGIPMVIQNSGNNVLIQNSTILNLQLQ